MVQIGPMTLEDSLAWGSDFSPLERENKPLGLGLTILKGQDQDSVPGEYL